MNPILKWVGGKRQLLDEIYRNMPLEFNSYHELFFGGGAVGLSLAERENINEMYFNDYNKDLIEMYEVIRDEPNKIINRLSKYKNTEEHFYKVRAWDRNPEEFKRRMKYTRASRMIYLNKTCFNGLFRVNSSGEFNVPFGNYKKPKIVDEELIHEMSKFLNQNNVHLSHGTYIDRLNYIQEGDFVYLDPPYIPISEGSDFTSYTSDGFDYNDQIKLRDFCNQLSLNGVYIMQSNSYSPFIVENYEQRGYRVEIVYARRSINSNGNGREPIREYLIMNYDENGELLNIE